MKRYHLPSVLIIMLLSIFAFEGNAQFCDDCTGADPACDQPATVDNPDLTASCSELQIVFVIDESGSIGSGADNVKDGVIGFLNALKCTEAEVAIIEFSTNAQFVVGTYSLIDNALIDGITDYFNGIPFNGQTYSAGGGTNWQDAMMLADGLVAPDVLFFFTDGNPSYYNLGTDGMGAADDCGDGGTTQAPEIVNPVIISNNMKSEGTHVFMLGINGPSGLATQNLIDMSGSTQYDPDDPNITIANSDYAIENFANLATCLEMFAQELCPISTSCVANHICDGGSTGSITITVDIPATSYDYTYSGPVSGSGSSAVSPFTITGLPAGTYDIEVSINVDASCTRIDECSVEILQPTCEVIATNVSCPGEVDGTATVVPSGGVPPYDIVWNTTATTSSISGLAPGVYSATVTDADGCMTFCSAEVFDSGIDPAEMPDYDDLCAGNGTTILGGGTPEGGVYSGPGVTDNGNGTDFTFDPAAAGTGTHTIDYAVTIPPSTTQDTIWLEDFEDLSLEAAADPGATSWTTYCVDDLDCAINDPDDNEHLWVDNGDPIYNLTQVMEGQGLSDAGAWKSEMIVIFGYADVSVTLDIMENSGLEGSGSNIDSISIYYAVDGGPQNLIHKSIGNFNTLSPTISGISGTTLELFVYIRASSTSEIISFDNVLVEGSLSTVGCELSASSSISVSDINCTITSSTDATCGDQPNGSFTVTGSDGVAPYTFDLGGGNTNMTGVFNNLTPGSYIVTVTDAQMCETTCAVEIGEINNLSCSISVTDASCGLSDGQLVVTVTNGSGNFEYTITGGDIVGSLSQTSNTFSNLSGGSYTVTVEDLDSSTGTDCTTSCSATIDEINNLSCTISVVDATCGNNDGQLTVNVSGGSGNYEYTFSGGNIAGTIVQTSNVLSGLEGGAYMVEVEDLDSSTDTDCTTSCNATILEINDLSCSISVTDATCGNEDGQLVVNVTGGSGNFQYTLTGGGIVGSLVQLVNTFTNLEAGSYSVEVEDLDSSTGTDCTTTCSATIDEINDISCSIAVVDASCGNEDGQLTVTVTGGSGNIEYTLSGSNIPMDIVQTNNVFSNLPGGDYTVSIIDLDAVTPSECTSSCDATINETTDITCVLEFIEPECGVSNGQITVIVTNGSGNFEYTLDSDVIPAPIVQVNNNVFTDLPGGEYTATVVDLNSNTGADCTTECSGFLDEINNLSCSTTVTDATCGNSDGSILVEVMNGSGSFEYYLTGDNIPMAIVQIDDPLFENLPAGDYTIEVIDALSSSRVDCSTVCFATINEINDLSCSTTVIDATCGNADGQITITVVNGSGNFEYTLTGGNLGAPIIQTNNNVFTGLSGGDYTIEVQDLDEFTDVGCLTSCDATVLEVNNLSCSIAVTNSTCGNADGALVVTVQNGSGNFEYTLTGGDLANPIVQTNNTFSNLVGGSYSVFVEDLDSTTDTDCTTSCDATIDEINNLSCTIQTTDATCGNEDGSLSVTVQNGSGNYEFTLTGGNLGAPIVQNTNTFSNLSGGSYTVTVVDLDGSGNCETTCDGFINEVGNISCTTSVTNTGCGLGNGIITTTVTNGSGNFEFSLTGGNLMNPIVQNNGTFTGLFGGSYVVEVTDLNSTTGTDCSTTCFAVINEINDLSCTVNVTDATCGNADGSLEVIVTNGSGNFEFTLTGGDLMNPIVQTSNVFSNLPGGFYLVNFIDLESTTSNSCNSSCVAIIAENNNLSCTIEVTDASCGLSNGILTVTVMNGSGNFQYTLTGGDLIIPLVQNTNVFSDLSGGDYVVSVTDLGSSTNNGCSTNCLATIGEVNNLSCSIQTSNANCGTATGSLTVTVMNGSGNFQYTLTGGDIIVPIVQNSNVFTGLVGGDYMVNVLDLDANSGSDCTTSCTAFIDETNDLSCSIDVEDASCGSSTGSITVTVMNGSGNFQYTLTGGDLANPIVQTSNVFADLPGGMYSATVIDLDSSTDTDCSTTCTGVIGEVNNISCSISVSNSSCDSPTGTLTVTVFNGSGNYEFTLTGGDLANPIVQSSNVFNDLGEGNYTVSVMDLDASNPDDCVSTCMASITLFDDQAPDISCPESSNAQCDISEVAPFANLQEFLDAGGTVSDNCGLDSASFIMTREVSDNLSCPETITRTYQIMDLDGNVDSCFHEILLFDTTPPRIDCPENLTGDCSVDEFEGYKTLDEFINAGGFVDDNCGIDPASFTLLSVVDDMDSCPKTITRTYQIADLCGNVNTCTQTVTIDDTEFPTFSCPGPLTADCSIDQLPAYETLTDFINAGGFADDNCGIDESSFVMLSEISDNNSCPETIVRIYQIADLCGNTDTCTQVITVNDVDPPSFEIDDVSLLCAGNPDDLGQTGEPYNVFDNCGIADISFTNDSSNLMMVGLNYVGDILRTWTVTDLCGNDFSLVQTITIDDNTPDPQNMTLNVCEDIPGSGVANNIDLTSLNDMLSPSLDPYSVTWYMDPGLTILVLDPTNVSVTNGQMFYAQIIDASSGCGNITVIEYIVDDSPDAMMVMPAHCEDTVGSGNAVIDLTSYDMLISGGQMGVGVMWFTDEALNDQILNAAMYLATDMDTVYAYLSLGNCTSTIAVGINIEELPTITDPNIQVCEDQMNSGSAIVDLTSYNNIVNPNMNITWFDGDPDNGGTAFQDPTNVPLPLMSGNNLFALAMSDNQCMNSDTIFYDILGLPIPPQIDVVTCSQPDEDLDLTFFEPFGIDIVAWYDGDPLNGGAEILNPTSIVVPLPSGNDIYYAVSDGFCINYGVANVINHETGTLVCKDVNISLNGSCELYITPEFVLQGNYDTYSAYIVYIITADGDTISNPITSEYIGQTLTVSIVDICDGNSCWSYATIEDKMAPNFECVNDTVSCFNYVRTPPLVFDNCDSELDVYLIGEEILNVNCEVNPDFNIIYEHTWVAVDDSGNSDTCTRLTYIERIEWDSIQFPTNYMVSDDNALECSELIYDDEGNLDPAYYGVPTIDGIPLYPETDAHCNFYVSFNDFTIPTFNCVSKVMRTWTLSEWHCSEDSVQTYIQIIEIDDNTAPTIECPGDIEVSAAPQSCEAEVVIPPAIVSDLCSNIDHVDLQVPGNYYQNTNGITLSLPVGTHELTYFVYDECLNVDSCSFTVTVIDVTPPIAICDQNTVVALTANGLGRVYPSTIDDGSYDLCGIDSFAVARVEPGCGYGTDWGPYVEFSCCDLTDEPIMVMLGVWDISGNFSSCMASVYVQDQLDPVFTDLPDITISCGYPHDIQGLDQFGKLVIIDHPDDLQNPDSPIDSIIINDPGNPESQPKFWGFDAYVYDNCGPLQVSQDSAYFIDNCGEGYIRRTFTITESTGQTHAFNQYIFIENFDPFTGEDIIWPEDLFVTTSCVYTLLHPDSLPAPYGYPIITEDACDLVGISFKDEVFDITEPNACTKILRSWKVINWCEEGVVNNNYTEYDYQQIIKLLNNESPVFTSCEDTSACIDGTDCDNAYIELAPTVTDDCTPSEYLYWSYTIDLYNNGVPDQDGLSSNASGYYPLGDHKIIWTVEDGCGNATSCTQLFSITSCVQPTPYCYNGLAVELDPIDTNNDGVPDNAEVVLWASDVDAGSYQICGNPVTVSFSEDVNDTSITFDCDDLGEQIIELWVTDDQGNQDYCVTYIIVQDNNNVCTNTTTNTFKVTGEIESINGNPIISGNILMDDGTGIESQGILDGTFSLNSLLEGSSYKIGPFKNDDPKNGVTTFDLVLIQQHILGIKPFQMYNEFIAADVNKDKKITAIDVVEVRKMVLGYDSLFANNNSWRFHHEDLVFPNPSIAHQMEFSEFMDLESVSEDHLNETFIGIKVGDINVNAVTDILYTENRSEKPVFNLEFDSKQVENGEEFIVHLYPASDENILGFQVAFDFDADQIAIQEVYSNSVSIEQNNIRIYDEDQGGLAISWHDATPVRTNIDQSLISIRFVAKERVSTAQLFSVNANLIEPEIYLSDLTTLRLDKKLSADQNQQDLDRLMQNRPNPFTESTKIAFYLNETKQVNFRITDINGRNIYTESKTYAKGQNSIDIKASMLKNAGVYYYSLQTDQGTFSQKMILTN